ncbi:MAG TPA: hypothetical protein VHC63_01925 [Acidimicrobiales bacterium]|nr:hypothetical protein [Acidimicrobiales bacterium]
MFVLSAAALVLLAWLARRRRPVRNLGDRRGALPAGSSVAIRHRVRLTNILELDGDVLVGYRAADSRGVLLPGHLALAGMVYDTDVMRVLHHWWSAAAPLAVVVSPAGDVIGFVHEHSRTAVVTS